MYHYAGNNPVKYVDPDGNQMVVPAPIGMPLGVSSIGSSTSNEDFPAMFDDGIIRKNGNVMLSQNKDSKKKDSGRNLKASASAPCPAPGPDHDNEDDDDNYTPEELENKIKNIEKQYKQRLDNSKSSTETPDNPSPDNDPADTPKSLTGWGKFIYFVGKLSELFDNYQ